MPNSNFIIGYDLMFPGQHYARVQDSIKSLGKWYQLQYSAFYVNTAYTAQQCDGIVSATLDTNDRLFVSDSRHIVIRGISQADLDAINRVWFAERAAYAA